MRPLTGTSKTRRLSSILAGSLAILSLSACAAEQTQVAMLGPPPYLALATGQTPSAMAERSGYFSQENGCIVFRPAQSDESMVPVFRAGETALATDGTQWLGLFFHDEPVALGKAYRVAGAAAPIPQQIALASPIPARCPGRYFVVQSVGDTLADADAERFCVGVIVCASYRVN